MPGPHPTPGPARRPSGVQNPAVPQTSLPQTIPPYSLPFLEKQADGTLINDTTWYLYLYNLSRQVLPLGGNPPVITQVILEQVPPPPVFFQEADEGESAPIVPGLSIFGQTGAAAVSSPGMPGIDGMDGDDGLTIFGQSGATGLAGAQGVPGIDGADGDEGMPVPGPQGPVAPALGFSGSLTTNTIINDTTGYTTGGVALANQTAANGSCWRVRAQGQFVAALSITARNAQVAAFWGSTQLVAITAAVLTSTAQTSNWQLEFILTGTGTTAIWTAGSMINEMASATALAISQATPASTSVTAGAQTLDLRFSMSVAVATDQWIVQSVTMERLN